MNILLSNNLPDRPPLPCNPSSSPRHPTTYLPPCRSSIDLPPLCCANLQPNPCCINHSVHGHYRQNQRYPLSFIPTRLGNIFRAPDGNTAFIRRVIPMYMYIRTIYGWLSVYLSSLLDSSDCEIPKEQYLYTKLTRRLSASIRIRAVVHVIRVIPSLLFRTFTLLHVKQHPHWIRNCTHPNPRMLQ